MKSIQIMISFLLSFIFATEMFAQISDTNQVICYENTEMMITCPVPGEAYYGQDASYHINPQSFTKLDANGNELPDSASEWFMVKDNVTGLIWEEKQAYDGYMDYSNPNDADNLYAWYNNNEEYAGSYNENKNTAAFIADLNAKQFGGYNDWRLPEIKELISILDLSLQRPTIDWKYFQNIQLSSYWSSTRYMHDPTQSWLTKFESGNTNYSEKAYPNYVRAVRGPKPFNIILIN